VPKILKSKGTDVGKIMVMYAHEYHGSKVFMHMFWFRTFCMSIDREVPFSQKANFGWVLVSTREYHNKKRKLVLLKPGKK